jgi:predicted permease
MRLLRGLQVSFRWLLRRLSEERDLTDELRDHLARETERFVSGGLSLEAARRAALCEIGGIEQVKEQCRDAQRMRFIDGLLQDSRYGVRKLGQSPVFSLAVVLTLALGIGANTAIFSLIDAVLWKTLPVREPQELVLFGAAEGNFGGDLAQVGAWGAYSFPLYNRFKDKNLDFQGLCAFQSYTSRLNVRIAGTPARVVSGKVVSGNYFSVLGLHPYLGRMLNDADDQAGSGPDVAVVSYRAWMRLFSGDPNWIGRSVDVNGRSITIIGVTPPEFFGENVEPEPAELWLPIHLQPLTMLQSSYLGAPEMHWLNIMGRLKHPNDLSAAQIQLTHVLQQFLLADVGPGASADKRRLISTCHVDLAAGGRGISKLRKRFSAPLRVLMAIVALILLIACVNIANLLLARTVGRQREILMRLVLGASRYRLIRQLLTESALLALLAGAIGVLISSLGTKVLLHLLSQNGHAFPLDVSASGAVLAFTGCVSLLATFLFGLAPALRSTKLDLAPLIVGSKAGARVGAAELLIMGQLAMSVLLLTTAALLIRSFNNLESQNLGFQSFSRADSSIGSPPCRLHK